MFKFIKKYPFVILAGLCALSPFVAVPAYLSAATGTALVKVLSTLGILLGAGMLTGISLVAQRIMTVNVNEKYAKGKELAEYEQNELIEQYEALAKLNNEKTNKKTKNKSKETSTEEDLEENNDLTL